jgi:hypothetical protein
MPTYTFRNSETEEMFEQFFSSYAKKDEFLVQNPQLQQVLQPVAFGDSIRMGLRKPDDAFRDKLKDIKRAHRRSTINTF